MVAEVILKRLQVNVTFVPMNLACMIMTYCRDLQYLKLQNTVKEKSAYTWSTVLALFHYSSLMGFDICLDFYTG